MCRGKIEKRILKHTASMSEDFQVLKDVVMAKLQGTENQSMDKR